MPGYGRSTPAPRDAGFDHVLATLVRFVTHTLGISRAHFVGLSVGGMILQHLAARHPDLTRSIAILGSSPKFGFSGDSSGAEFLSWVQEGLNAGPQARFSENMIRAIVGPKADEAAIQMAMAAMNTATREGLEFAARLIAQHDALDLLPKITTICCRINTSVGSNKKLPVVVFSECKYFEIPDSNAIRCPTQPVVG